VIGRALILWIVIIAAETLHGIARMMFLAPAVGDLPARQIGVATGSVIVLAIAYLGSRWLGCRSVGATFAVGGLWVALTVAFEIVLGRFVLGLPWDRLLSDFDLARGGLLPLGLAAMAAAPWLAARMRGERLGTAVSPAARD
jgi:hypothetical protein